MATVNRRVLKIAVFILIVFFLSFAVYYHDGLFNQIEVPIETKMKEQTRLTKNRMDKAEVKDLKTNIMEERKSNLAMACESLRQKQILPAITEAITLPLHVSISDDFKLFGCVVCKVGSTNIRRVVYLLDHLTEINDSNRVSKRLAKYWPIPVDRTNETVVRETQRKLQEYTKFLFVREPFERLVSAYRGRNPGSMFNNKNWQFNEFLDFILSRPPDKLNVHHKPIHLICKPCEVNYDFIGQLNNFEEDMNSILEYVGAPKDLTLPSRNRTGYKEHQSFDVVEQYKQNTSKEVLKRLYDHYYMDYFLFGFPKLV